MSESRSNGPSPTPTQAIRASPDAAKAGADFETDVDAAEVEGVGWIDVREIEVDGVAGSVEWLNDATWRIRVPLAPGANVVALTALNRQRAAVGADSVTITEARGPLARLEVTAAVWDGSSAELWSRYPRGSASERRSASRRRAGVHSG